MMYFIEVFIFLTLFAINILDIQCLSNISELSLTKDPSYNDLLPTHTRYQIASISDISPSVGALECLLRKPRCAGLLYNANVRMAVLLMCYLNERSVNRTFIEPGWNFLADFRVCSDGWVPYSGHCYLHIKNRTKWSEAKNICDDHDGYLLQTETSEEALWVTEAFLKPSINSAECSKWEDCSCWIGANDFSIEGSFTWNHGSDEFNAAFWYPGQPNNYGGVQDCVSLTRYAQLNDILCSYNFEIVCESDKII